jgi:hypothetical protein
VNPFEQLVPRSLRSEYRYHPRADKIEGGTEGFLKSILEGLKDLLANNSDAGTGVESQLDGGDTCTAQYSPDVMMAS